MKGWRKQKIIEEYLVKIQKKNGLTILFSLCSLLFSLCITSSCKTCQIDKVSKCYVIVTKYCDFLLIMDVEAIFEFETMFGLLWL